MIQMCWLLSLILYSYNVNIDNIFLNLPKNNARRALTPLWIYNEIFAGFLAVKGLNYNSLFVEKMINTKLI